MFPKHETVKLTTDALQSTHSSKRYNYVNVYWFQHAHDDMVDSISPKDHYNMLLLWEEGRMFRRLLEHHKAFPSSSPMLALVAMPFCALVEHDGIDFVNRTFDIKLPLDDKRIHKLRNLTKSLGAKGMRYEDYSSETNELMNGLTRTFKNHTGLFGNVLNTIQSDTGLHYYKGLPIGSTYSAARYLFNSRDGDGPVDFSNPEAGEFGLSIGESAAFFYRYAESLPYGEEYSPMDEFAVKSNDVHLSKLLAPLKERGIDDPAVFFFLTDLMFQLNAVVALTDCGLFTRRLNIKFGTAALYGGLRSVRAFTRYAMGVHSENAFPADTVKTIGRVYPRAIAKAVLRAEPLRHALVHYDFSHLSSAECAEGEHPDEMLVMAIAEKMDMKLPDYERFLFEASAEVSSSIAAVTEFPSYNPYLDPGC